MATLIVLFNLKPGITVEEYEQWAKTADLPTVRGHKSVDGFDLFKTKELFRQGKPAPYQYMEVITINDMDQFGKDVTSEAQQKISARFGEIAADRVAILADKISD